MTLAWLRLLRSRVEEMATAFLKWHRTKSVCVCVCFVSFQESEADLGESEEYKEARNMLDSVKLEG